MLELSAEEKQTIEFQMDRVMMGRHWWKGFINHNEPTYHDKQKVLYATKYALSVYYGINSPKQMLMVSDEMLKKLNLWILLDKIVMRDTPELTGVDMNYITRQIYPHYFRESEVEFEKRLVQNYYNKAIEGNVMLAKQYFSQVQYRTVAVKRALWCLEEMLNANFSSIKDMYDAFSQSDILTRLKTWRLLNAYKNCTYDFPIDYLHDCVKSATEHTEEWELYYQIKRYQLLVVRHDDEVKKRAKEAL